MELIRGIDIDEAQLTLKRFSLVFQLTDRLSLIHLLWSLFILWFFTLIGLTVFTLKAKAKIFNFRPCECL